MDKRIRLKITMALLSDAIFGSGYSIPGEEDIAVCKDEHGYPYMKGSTFKGLLRESMENLALWENRSLREVNEMAGEAGWNGAAEERRIHLTSLKLVDAPDDPEKCYAKRIFTSLEDGIVKDGTLRTAVCITRGSAFTGELICAEEDAAFIRKALSGIKWVGTLRNRGFGRVRVCGEIIKKREETHWTGQAGCFKYSLRTELPVVITDLNRSKGYHYETLDYIPGSAVRGAIMGKLALKEPQWFAEHKQELLREVYVLDAMPNHQEKTVLPSLKGFYEKKDGSSFQSVLKNGELSPGVKRAGLGNFCAIEKNQIVYWSAETSGITRIRKGTEKEKLMFQTHYLCEGQIFDGYIISKKADISKRIATILEDEIWIGADRYEGFGKCHMTLAEVEAPLWRKQYGYTEQMSVGKVLYMLAISPFCMQDEYGNPCGFDEKQLALMLGIGKINILFCSTSVSEFHTYNRMWRCGSPTVRMYDRGSIFKLECDETPEVDKILALQKQGLGIRKEEGFGQILFIRPDIYESITGKCPWQEEKEEKKIASERKAKYRWVMGKSQEDWWGGLSNSQIGEIQMKVEESIRQSGDTEDLKKHLKHNLYDRGAQHGDRFEKINGFINMVLDTPMTELIGVPYEFVSEQEETIAKMELLCMLFDYSRKGKEK